MDKCFYCSKIAAHDLHVVSGCEVAIILVCEDHYDSVDSFPCVSPGRIFTESEWQDWQRTKPIDKGPLDELLEEYNKFMAPPNAIREPRSYFLQEEACERRS